MGGAHGTAEQFEHQCELRWCGQRCVARYATGGSAAVGGTEPGDDRRLDPSAADTAGDCERRNAAAASGGSASGASSAAGNSSGRSAGGGPNFARAGGAQSADDCRADSEDHDTAATGADLHRRVEGAQVSDAAVALADESLTFPAMAGECHRPDDRKCRTVGAGAAGGAGEAVRAIFAEVEAQCTRFDPASPLMRANAAGERWCAFRTGASERSRRPRRRTTEPPACSTQESPATSSPLAMTTRCRSRAARSSCRIAAIGRPVSDRPWRPAFDARRRTVRIGPDPIDLGGIGKGLALRWSADALRGNAARVMIEAGGDCWLAGDGPSPPGWQVAVENPDGSDTPVAVLSLAGSRVRDVFGSGPLLDGRWTTGSPLDRPPNRQPGWTRPERRHRGRPRSRDGRSPQQGAVSCRARPNPLGRAREQDAAALWVTDTGEVADVGR